MRDLTTCVRRALVVSVCVAAVLPVGAAAADVPDGSTIRALMRGYFKDQDGAKLAEFIGDIRPGEWISFVILKC